VSDQKLRAVVRPSASSGTIFSPFLSLYKEICAKMQFSGTAGDRAMKGLPFWSFFPGYQKLPQKLIRGSEAAILRLRAKNDDDISMMS